MFFNASLVLSNTNSWYPRLHAQYLFREKFFVCLRNLAFSFFVYRHRKSQNHAGDVSFLLSKPCGYIALDVNTSNNRKLFFLINFCCTKSYIVIVNRLKFIDKSI